MLSRSFFNDCPSFNSFEELENNEHYHHAPKDWCLVLTDVRGSTKAIEQGKYQQVNLSGAATIAATINAIKGVEIPYVFGGDGATLMVPEQSRHDVKKALARTKFFIKKMYGLEMLMSIIPVHSVLKHGGQVQVAKFSISEGNNIAFFRGGGLTLAEEWLKKGAPKNVEIESIEEDSSQSPDLEGLSCRWQPIPSQYGVMLSLLVYETESKGDQYVYKEVLAELDRILDGRKRLFTHSQRNYSPKWPPQSLEFEVKSRFRESILFGYLFLGLQTLVLYFVFKLRIPIGSFSSKKYRQELVNNTDFKKFDDMLRMVIDCTPSQAQQIEDCLQQMRGKFKLVFGTHRSDRALMTCLVEAPTQGQHLHFIDGADGGYALAAYEMKRQIKELETKS